MSVAEKSGSYSVACPTCGHRGSLVVDSRPRDDGTHRRRRHCVKCGRRYTTREILDDTAEQVGRDREMLDRIRALPPESAAVIERVIRMVSP